jgi:hypothetical protein
MHILIWIGRSFGTRPSKTFLDSAGRFSTSSRRNSQNPNPIEVSILTIIYWPISAYLGVCSPRSV